MEQLPPLSLAGTEYILVKLRQSEDDFGDHVKVIAMGTGTNITFQGVQVTITADRQVRTMREDNYV